MHYYAKITKQKEGEFLVIFPDLDGCFTEGRSLREAKLHASQALNLWLKARCEMEDHMTIPKPKIRRGKNYYAVDVDPLVIPAVFLKQTRLEMGLSLAERARELGIASREYAKYELPLKTVLPRGTQHEGKIKARASLPKTGGVTVRVSVDKK